MRSTFMVIQNFDILNFLVNGNHKLPPDSESSSVNYISETLLIPFTTISVG